MGRRVRRRLVGQPRARGRPDAGARYRHDLSRDVELPPSGRPVSPGPGRSVPRRGTRARASRHRVVRSLVREPPTRSSPLAGRRLLRGAVGSALRLVRPRHRVVPRADRRRAGPSGCSASLPGSAPPPERGIRSGRSFRRRAVWRSCPPTGRGSRTRISPRSSTSSCRWRTSATALATRRRPEPMSLGASRSCASKSVKCPCTRSAAWRAGRVLGQVRGFVEAACAGGAIGLSLYDFETTRPRQWDELARPGSCTV